MIEQFLAFLTALLWAAHFCQCTASGTIVAAQTGVICHELQCRIFCAFVAPHTLSLLSATGCAKGGISSVTRLSIT